MRYFLDTEFDENGSTINLISIALVAEDGRELYLVSSEFSVNAFNDWVKANVLPLLPSQDSWGEQGGHSLCHRSVRRR